MRYQFTVFLVRPATNVIWVDASRSKEKNFKNFLKLASEIFGTLCALIMLFHDLIQAD
jgi:hypothetical protein